MNRIKELRLKRGLKQADLATLVRVKQNTISNWENEVTEIDKQSLVILTNFFNVSADYLLGISDTQDNADKSLDKNDSLTTLEDYVTEKERSIIELYRKSSPEKQAAFRLLLGIDDSDLSS
jgi:transcriptional regulator with XRE-family HTH domain